MGGIGVVVRDENGHCIAALSKSVKHAHSVLSLEAEACRAGVLLGLNQGWTEIDIESDSAILIAALKDKEMDLSVVSRVLDDCREYLNSFHSVSIRHIYREANSVADRLAHFACKEVVDYIWLGESPAIIQDVLYEDNMHCTTLARGSGYMSPSLQNYSNIINGTGRGDEPPS